MDQKWEAYFAGGEATPPPWESSRPSSHVVRFLEEILLDRGATVVDLGCGGGLNTLHAAEAHGANAIGIDASINAIALATARLSVRGANANLSASCRFLQGDLLQSDAWLSDFAGTADAVMDVQTWHAMRGTDGEHDNAFVYAVAKLLKVRCVRFSTCNQQKCSL